MEPAVYTAAGGIIVGLMSAGVAMRATREARHAKLLDRQLNAEELLKKFSEPLATAAFDLQSRCYNIVSKGFFRRFGSHHERFPDAVMTTLFRFAQYFGWAEILRREIQYLSFPNKDDQTKVVSRTLGEIAGCLASSDDDERLMMWVDEQRAIGERMIDDEHASGPRCLGYAAFCDAYDERFAQLFERVVHDVAAPGSEARLAKAQHKLCHLVWVLDPAGRRYDKARMKLAPTDTELVGS